MNSSSSSSRNKKKHILFIAMLNMVHVKPFECNHWKDSFNLWLCRVFFSLYFFPNKPHVSDRIATSNRSCPEREKSNAFKRSVSNFLLSSIFKIPWFIISSGIVNSVVTLFWLMPIACKRFVLLIRFALFLEQADFSAFVIVCVGSANACICSIGVNIMLRNDHF